MKGLMVVVVLSGALLSGCSYGEPTQGPATGGTGTAAVATSPTASDDPAPSALPQAALQQARQFRGNPRLLAVFMGALLVAALALGAFTVGLAVRRSSNRRG
jgi:hypothetical protein